MILGGKIVFSKSGGHRQDLEVADKDVSTLPPSLVDVNYIKQCQLSSPIITAGTYKRTRSLANSLSIAPFWFD